MEGERIEGRCQLDGLSIRKRKQRQVKSVGVKTAQVGRERSDVKWEVKAKAGEVSGREDSRGGEGKQDGA